MGTLATQAAGVLERFPFVMAAALVAAGAAMAIANAQGEPSDDLWRLLSAATLGLPLFTTLAVTAERRPGWTAQLAGGALGMAALAAYYAAWSGWTTPQRAFHYVQLSVAFHLLVAVLPFVRRPLERAFWQYNRLLLERFLLAAVFSAVIFLGLALALAAVHNLLGVDIEDEAYARVWVAVVFVGNTWIFLAGVPADLDALERREDYPRALKVLTQRVLVPLVSLYVVILTLYLLRIIATRHWPSGWVGWLVSALGLTGTLALLLVYPIARDQTEGWVSRFARDFWIAVMPAVAMLWLAIRQRVAQYGFTEPRYFLTLLSLWLFGTALFYTLRRSRDLRVIPGSLAMLALVTLAGPWSAASVSLRSQLHRLAGLLTANGMLADGRIHAPTLTVPGTDGREIAAVVQYLVDTHGSATVVRWFAGFGVSLDSVVNARYDVGQRVARRLGVTQRRPGATAGFNAQDEAPLEVSGYDLLLRDIVRRRAPADTGFLAQYVASSRTVIVFHGTTPLVRLSVDSAIRAGRADTSSPPRSPLQVRGRGARWDALLRIRYFAAADSGRAPPTLGGVVLLRRRR